MLVSSLIKALIASLINHAIRPLASFSFRVLGHTQKTAPRSHPATRNAVAARGQSACRSRRHASRSKLGNWGLTPLQICNPVVIFQITPGICTNWVIGKAETDATKHITTPQYRRVKIPILSDETSCLILHESSD